MISVKFIQVLAFLYILVFKILQNLQEMQPRHNSRKFHRSPRIQPQSPQALPLNSVLSSKQYMSPVVRNHSDSFDEGYQYQQNENTQQPTFDNIVERLTQLQMAIREDRSQRLDQHTKLIKMIKQMECKHSSIIYDTEIRYNKFGFRPELFGTGNSKETRNQSDKSIKKVSSYIFQKNLPSGKNQHISVNVNSLKKSDVEISKKTEASEQSSKVFDHANQNPEKNKHNSSKQQKQISLATSQQAQNSTSFESKIQDQFNKKLQKIQEQTNGLINQKFFQLKQSIKQSQSKLSSKMASLIPKQANLPPISATLEQNLAAFKQSRSEQITKHSLEIAKHTNDLTKMSAELGKIFGQLTKQSHSFSSVYAQMTRHSNQISKSSNQLSKQSNELIRQSNQLAKYQNQLNLYSTQTGNYSTLHTQIQKLQFSLQTLETTAKNNTIFQISKLSYKIEQMYGLIHDLSNPLRERFTQADIIISQHGQKIQNILRICENDYNNLTHKINQIENYFVLKLEANQKGIGNINNQQMRLSAQFENQRNKRINQDIQMLKKKQQQDNKIEQKLNNLTNSKVEVARVTLLKEIKGCNKKIEDQVVGMIEKHIEYLEKYLRNVEEKQSFLNNKFISSTQENNPTTFSRGNPRITGGIKLTGNEKFVENVPATQQKHQIEGRDPNNGQNCIINN